MINPNINTLTRQRAKVLIAYLKSHYRHSTWEKVGADVGFAYSIKNVVGHIRRNPELYDGTIQYCPGGSNDHFIGFIWPGMPRWYAQAARFARLSAEMNMTQRYETDERVDAIIATTLQDSSMLEHSHQKLIHHRAIVREAS